MTNIGKLDCKLFELSMPAKLRVETKDGMRDATCDHLDGMYSYCYLDDDRSIVFHLSGGTPLTLVDGKWEIKDV